MSNMSAGGCRSVQDCARNCQSCVNLKSIFSYHVPELEQVAAMYEIREKAYALAHTVMIGSPAGPDRDAAIRKIREAVMTANAAIVLKGRSG